MFMLDTAIFGYAALQAVSHNHWFTALVGILGAYVCLLFALAANIHLR